jgi:hypothetical protein
MMKVSSLIALLLLVLAGSSFWYFRKKPTVERKFNSTQELIDFLASAAVKDAREENHVNLDFSSESIEKVEQILSNLHDIYVKNPSSISANGLGSAYGAYIGEVIKRAEPGARWERDDEVGGEKSYPIIWGAGSGHSYPMAWCYHRIVNGPEDNVWVKYKILREKYGVLKGNKNSSVIPGKK